MLCACCVLGQLGVPQVLVFQSTSGVQYAFQSYLKVGRRKKAETNGTYYQDLYFIVLVSVTTNLCAVFVKCLNTHLLKTPRSFAEVISRPTFVIWEDNLYSTGAYLYCVRNLNRKTDRAQTLRHRRDN